MKTFRIPATAVAAAALAVTAGSAHAVDHSWTSGTFVAGVTAPNPLPAADTLTLSGTGTKTFDAVAFVNQGLVAHLGGNLRLSNGASVNNTGTWNIGNLGGPVHFGEGTTAFVNNGIVRKVAGTGTSNFGTAGVNVSGAGIWEAQTGTLGHNAPGTVFGSGTRFTGAGVNRIGVELAMVGTMQSENLVLASGSRIAGSSVVLEGSTVWQAGTLTGSWTMPAGSTLSLTGVGGKRVEGAGTEVVLAGMLGWTGAGGITVADGATLRNQGLLEQSGSGGSSSIVAAGIGSSFINEGLVRNTGGIGMNLAFAGGTLVNDGTIEVSGSGAITLPTGFNNTGTLAGVGNFSIAGSGLVNAGVLAPGAAAGGAGTLVLGNSNSFAQGAGGTLSMDIGSLTEHDFLDVVGSGFGSATLAGTLQLNCLGACSLDVGDEVTILRTRVAILGQFDQVVLNGFATGAFDVIYEINPGADFVRLRVTEAVTAVPEPQTWALFVGGLGALGFIARRRRLR